MKRELIWMLLASFFGGLIGAYFMANLHPLNNAEIFIVIFALIGVAVGNLGLLALCKINENFYSNQ